MSQIRLEMENNTKRMQKLYKRVIVFSQVLGEEQLDENRRKNLMEMRMRLALRNRELAMTQSRLRRPVSERFLNYALQRVYYPEGMYKSTLESDSTSETNSTSEPKPKKRRRVHDDGDSINKVGDPESNDPESNDDDFRYCFCGSSRFNDTVQCCNLDCEIEIFHWKCVGLSGPPDLSWYCRMCASELKSEGSCKVTTTAQIHSAHVSDDSSN